MTERVIESASGALQLRVIVERADLFAMTVDDRAAFDAVRDALDRLGGGLVIVKVDEPAPTPTPPQPTPAALPTVEERLVGAAVAASAVRANTEPGRVKCRWCPDVFTTKGIHHHERACRKAHDPSYVEELRFRAAAPIVEEPPTPESPARSEPVAEEAVVHPREVVDLPSLTGLEDAVRATGVAPPGLIGAASRAFLRDALAADDLVGFLTRTPDRTVSLIRRECGLDPEDRTLDWLQAFVGNYRKASAA